MRSDFFTGGLLHEKSVPEKGKVWGHSVPEIECSTYCLGLLVEGALVWPSAPEINPPKPFNTLPLFSGD